MARLGVVGVLFVFPVTRSWIHIYSHALNRKTHTHGGKDTNMLLDSYLHVTSHLQILRPWSEGLRDFLQSTKKEDVEMMDSTEKGLSVKASQEAQPAESLVPVTARQAASTAASGCVVNSTTHPDAYAWLNRSAKSGRGILPPEVLEEWEAGGTRRSKLLTSFVRRVYVPHAQQRTNVLRLEAWNRIQQCTKDFSRSFKGFAWHTEEEIRTVLKWNELLSCFKVQPLQFVFNCGSGRILLLVDFPSSFLFDSYIYTCSQGRRQRELWSFARGSA